MQSVNLLEKATGRATQRDGLRQVVLAAVLSLMVLGTVGMLERATLANLRTELARTQTQSERLRSEQAALVGPNAQWLARIDAEEREVQAVESVAQQLRSGSLGSTLGFAEQLRAFGRATTPGVWLTGLTLDNTTDAITIDGKALDASRVPALLHALQADPHFGGTRLASIELTAGEGDGKEHPISFHIATPVAGGTGPAVAGGAIVAANATDLVAGSR